MPAHTVSNPDVEGCFEVTLARGLNMSRKRLPIQTAVSKHKRRFFSLEDNKRYELAAALQWEYRRRSSWVKEDERALQILNDQYSNAQYFVTPVHRVPVEILMEIFRIIFGNHPSPIVMLVCHRWYNVIQAMSGLQVPVELRTWTAPDIVTRAASGMGRRLLNITIDTDQDRDLEVPPVVRYSAFAIAVESTSQWRSLTVQSLPRGQQLGDPTLHKILSMDTLPMSQLEELKITSEVDPSPLIDRLLQIISATAMECLMTIETSSLYAIRFLLQATSPHAFHSLTTLKAVLPTLSEPIDILTWFSKLEVLEATNLLLPSYQNDSPLPFSQSLRRLYLKSGTIEWMAGQVFPLLIVCTIITPCGPFLTLDVHLPACTDFHFHHRSTALFARFHIPIVSSLVFSSNHWTPLQGSQGIVDMCMAGLGTVLQPRVLHLALLCNGSVLRMVLQDLPALEELHLELPRPSALGRGFFTSLMAKPVTIPYGIVRAKWFEWAEKQSNWHVAICPSLRVFNLYYQRWVRPSEQFGWIAPLLALGWTRRKTATPLQVSCVHMKTDGGNWKRVELVPVELQCLIDLDVPQLKHLALDRPTHRFVFQTYLTSVALSVIEGYAPWHLPNLTEAVFGTPLYRIRVLVLHRVGRSYTMLNVLHCFHQLEELSLGGVRSLLYPNDVDLPLLQTLQRLNLFGGCLKWLDGHTFVQLKSFRVGLMVPSWCGSFPNGVDMPACTHISLGYNCLTFLPVIHAAFALPLAAEWDLGNLRSYPAEGGTLSVIDALCQVQARVLRFTISTQFEHLITVIQPIYELEELSVEVNPPAGFRVVNKLLISLTEVTVGHSLTNTTNTSFDTRTIHTLTIATTRLSHGSERMICPNLKVLELKFSSVTSDQLDEVRQWCVQMMEGRRQAGCPLGRCRIWWFREGHGNDPSLVLSTSNEGIILEV